jgi:hypothetical protein
VYSGISDGAIVRRSFALYTGCEQGECWPGEEPPWFLHLFLDTLNSLSTTPGFPNLKRVSYRSWDDFKTRPTAFRLFRPRRVGYMRRVVNVRSPSKSLK